VLKETSGTIAAAIRKKSRLETPAPLPVGLLANRFASQRKTKTTVPMITKTI